jgi:hypothetical protein
MSDIVHAVTVVQLESSPLQVIQYRADCGSCKRRLWRSASFRISKVDYIQCGCGAMNVVRRPR